MKLRKVTIENFKCFGQEQAIDFGKLTLLTGANSSGKSSVMYSILGALQSDEFPYQFSINGKYVNMGDFREISYQHGEKNKIRIGYEFEEGNLDKLYSIWILDPVNNQPKLLALEISSAFFSVKVKAQGKKFILDFNYDENNNAISDAPIAKMLRGQIEQLKKSNESAKGASDDLYKRSEKAINDAQNILRHLESIDIKGVEIHAFPISVGAFHGVSQLKNITDFIKSRMRSFDAQVNFISSFRLNPDRNYLEKSKVNLKVEKYGEGYLDQIVLWETTGADEFKKLIRIMKRLSLFESIKTKRKEGGQFEILVKTSKGGSLSSLSDVGFGISQFLPIIVADIQLPINSTLFVAQPEIHLHPSVQSSFGEFIVRQIEETDKSYVIETHSEYFINRIRLAVVKGELKEGDLQVYFLENKDNDTIVHKIKFTEDGKILNAPPDFFKTYMIDVMEIALNAVG
jgi:predicted ATPase